MLTYGLLAHAQYSVLATLSFCIPNVGCVGRIRDFKPAMDDFLPGQSTNSHEVLKPFNSEPKSGGDNHKLGMDDSTANGTIPNHTANHISSDMNSVKLAGMMTPNHSVDMKSSSDKHSNSENKHSSVSKEKTHSSSKHHHHSSSSKHSSSSSKHHHSSSSGSSKPDGKHHSSSKDGKHHSSSSSKDGKHHHSSSSSSSKHHSSSSKDPSKSHSSSSSSHKSSSSKDSSKHHNSSSSSKDPSKSSHSSSNSSSKHHSSSSKHKDGHVSSHKPKEGSASEGKHSAENTFSQMNDSQSNKLPEWPKPENTGFMIKSEPMSPIKFEPKVESFSPHKEPTLSPIRIKIKPDVTAADNSDDDVPLSARLNKVKSEPVAVKRPLESDDEEPLSKKLEKVKKLKKENEEQRGKKHKRIEDDEFEPEKKKKKPTTKSPVKQETATSKRAAKKKEEEETKWKWWEEQKEDDGVKWKFLEHRGPLLAPLYEPLPSHVKFYYDGRPMKLTEATEEVATFYGRMLDHDYTTKDVFNKNFFKDWRKVMTPEEREIITDLKLCDFREILAYFKEQSEKKKAMSKEEKQVIKAQNEKIVEEYGWCIIDGHKQKIGNFRVEPPGLFRGRGNHPKQGMLKKRTMPEDIIVNCSKDSKYPEPPPGHKWKEIRHDNTVTWLACWVENIQGSTKYVMLNAASKLKGEKDFKKYEVARNLHKVVDKIRAQYREDWKSKEMRVRQRAVAMYFIDKLALRAGNEKDEDQADTVGCCSLRVEHITLHEKYEDKEYVVEFDFLGKDSIRYYNRVAVEKRVFKNLQLFKENKSDGDDLFDRLTTTSLNKYLQGLMDGLTAKVFRTYNASRTLQEQLDLLTNADDPLPAKLLSYNRANRAVAVLCNHQRAVPKNFSKQMENLQAKITAKREAVQDAKREVKKAKADYKAQKTETARKALERRKKALERLEMQLTKLEVQQTDKDENKEIALGTSKLNYLDPRISVAWCKKWDVPIEKIYNKTQREKFAWAIDMTDEDYRF